MASNLHLHSTAYTREPAIGLSPAPPMPCFTRLVVKALEPRHVAPLIREVLRDAMSEGSGPDIDETELRRCTPRARAHHRAWIATVGRSVIVGAVLTELDSLAAMRIRKLWVDADWRRTAVAEAMIEVVLHECWHDYVHTVLLEAPIRMGLALPIFHGSGYRFARRRHVRGRAALEFRCEMD